MKGHELRLWAVVMVPRGPTTGISRSQAYQHQMKEKKTIGEELSTGPVVLQWFWWVLSGGTSKTFSHSSFLPSFHKGTCYVKECGSLGWDINTSGLTCYTPQAQLPCKQILSTWGDQLHLMEWSKETDVCGQSTINAWFHWESTTRNGQIVQR